MTAVVEPPTPLTVSERWARRISSAPWVLGALALWLLCTAWLRPLLLPDEGRYAEVAREMLAGDGLVPLLMACPSSTSRR